MSLVAGATLLLAGATLPAIVGRQRRWRWRKCQQRWWKRAGACDAGEAYGVWTTEPWSDSRASANRGGASDVVAVTSPLVRARRRGHSRSCILAYRDAWVTISPHSVITSSTEEVAWTLYNCAYVYRRLAVYPVAITLQSTALNMWTALCDAKPALEPTMAACLNELGCAFAATHELAKALKHHQRALDIRRKCLASVGGRAEHEAAASSMHRLAMVHLAEGNTAAAKQLCEEALATAGAVHNSDSHYTVAHANQSLARARYRSPTPSRPSETLWS